MLHRDEGHRTDGCHGTGRGCGAHCVSLQERTRFELQIETGSKGLPAPKKTLDPSVVSPSTYYPHLLLCHRGSEWKNCHPCTPTSSTVFLLKCPPFPCTCPSVLQAADLLGRHSQVMVLKNHVCDDWSCSVSHYAVTLPGLHQTITS